MHCGLSNREILASVFDFSLSREERGNILQRFHEEKKFNKKSTIVVRFDSLISNVYVKKICTILDRMALRSLDIQGRVNGPEI